MGWGNKVYAVWFFLPGRRGDGKLRGDNMFWSIFSLMKSLLFENVVRIQYLNIATKNQRVPKLLKVVDVYSITALQILTLR